MATLLFGVDIPSNTPSANNYEAYEELPTPFAERLEDLMAVNTYDYATQVRAGGSIGQKRPLPYTRLSVPTQNPGVRRSTSTG